MKNMSLGSGNLDIDIDDIDDIDGIGIDIDIDSCELYLSAAYLDFNKLLLENHHADLLSYHLRLPLLCNSTVESICAANSNILAIWPL